MTGVFMKSRCLDKDTHTQRECYMNLKAEIRVMMCLQAKEQKRLPANHQNLEKRQGIDSPMLPSEGTNPANTLILVLHPPGCETINFFCLSYPVCGTLLWQF